MFLFLVGAFTALVSAEPVVEPEHYEEMAKMLQPHTEAMDSVALSELHAHLKIANPMQQIYDTANQMMAQIRTERTHATKAHIAYRRMCSNTKRDYSNTIDSNSKSAGEDLQQAASLYASHFKLWGQPNKMNASRAARNVSISQQEVKVKRGQASRDATHVEFLKLQAAFEKALGEIAVIGRVLNGEGTLGDRHGAVGFLEEQSCSSRFAKLKEQSDVPQVAAMLESFSKAFATLEAPTAAVNKNVAGAVGGKAAGTEAKVQTSTKDMDAINMILAKVRENMVKAMTISYQQETKLINLWKNEKQDRRKKINNDWITTWTNLRDQGKVEKEIGAKWTAEGEKRIKAAKHQKVADESSIMRDFLNAACTKESKAYPVTMSNMANELNALQAVVRYMKIHIFSKKGWGKSIMDVVSTPYKWKVESPVYVTVKNTYSTTNHDSDPVTCRTPYSTKFSKLRILSMDKTDEKFIDPNDLTHSTNYNPGMQEKLGDLNCQQFPTGIPVGRAHSCSEESYSTAVVDLTGTGYKFGKAAQRMFKTLGKKTTGSSIKFSNGDKTVTIKVRGRCGDIYADDAPASSADYRSDPIPVESA